MAAASWSDEETLKLISVWGEDAIQGMLEGCRRNKECFEKIAKEMNAAGHQRSAEQCSSKIKKLKYEYRKIKDKHGKTGEGRKNWKFLEAVDDVLGHKPATQPPLVVESGDPDLWTQQQAEGELPQGSSCESEGDGHSVQEKSASLPHSRSVTPVVDRQEGKSSQEDETPPDSGTAPKEKNSRTTPKEKKQSVMKDRKRKKGESRMDEMVEKLMKMQEESDRHYMRMEEKLLEMEERRQRESQEFQLRLMSFFGGQAAPSPPYNYPPTYPYMAREDSQF